MFLENIKEKMFIKVRWETYTQSQKNCNIFGVAFLLEKSVYQWIWGIHHFDKTDVQISHDPGSHDPDPGPQEKSTKKSCVSFETECSTGKILQRVPQHLHYLDNQTIMITTVVLKCLLEWKDIMKGCKWAKGLHKMAFTLYGHSDMLVFLCYGFCDIAHFL